jgi:CelD/BcsL family acetyltransferase involved in cellulose biosynthesis
LQIDVLKAAELNRDHVAAWSALQRADPSVDNPSFCPEFTQAVAAVRDDVEVAVLRQGRQFVGFFPFHRTRRNIGRPVGWLLTDMHGLVVAKNVDWDPWQILRECGLAAWHFDHLVASQEPFAPYFQCVEDAPFMDLSNGYDAYIADRRRAGNLSIKRAESKGRQVARGIGPLRFTLHDADRSLIDLALDWKRQQIVEKRYVDIFRRNWVVELLHRVCETQTAGFGGLVSTLHAGDQLLAIQPGMRGQHVISSWIPTFNPEFAKYSPGMLLHLELAKAAADMGVRRIDLGRGHNQLKSSLMSGAIPLALGAVDRRPINRLVQHCWYGVRDLMHSSRWGRAPLKVYRRVRCWIS